MSGLAVAALITLGMCGLMVCVGGIYGMLNPTPKPASVAGPPTAIAPVDTSPQVPSYRVVSDSRNQIAAVVDSLPAGDGLRTIFDDIRSKGGRPDGRYFVRINCSTGARIGSDNIVIENLMARGRFAVGGDGASEFNEIEGRSCPSPLPSPVAWLPPSAEAGYINDLSKLDPGLTVNVGRAISRATNTCADIKDGLSGDALAERVVLRLSGGNATINKKQAEEAIKLMRKWVCPHWYARPAAS